MTDTTDTWDGFFAGATTAFALCAAIGPLAINLLRQATRPAYGLVAASVTVACQSSLLTISILGLGQALASNPAILRIGVWVGAVLMFLYGTRVWVKALLLRSAKFTPSSGRSVRQTIVETLAINLFNPIALIQVIVLVGGISATYSGSARFAFLSAALAVVVLWFFGLAFGAAWLSPILARPMVQRGLDGMIGVLMYALAWSLISGQFD